MSAFALAINKILTVFFAVILIPFSALTHGIDLISEGERTDYAKTNVVGIGAYFRSQGMTSDGETFYFRQKQHLSEQKVTQKNSSTLTILQSPMNSKTSE